MDWITFIEDDFLGVFAGMGFKDLAMPIAFLLWLFILYMPLKGIDRRDVIAGLLYTLYCVTSGIVIFFAIPEYQDTWRSFDVHFSLAAVCGAIAAYRWFHGNDQVKVVMKTDNEKKPPVEMHT